MSDAADYEAIGRKLMALLKVIDEDEPNVEEMVGRAACDSVAVPDYLGAPGRGSES